MWSFALNITQSTLERLGKENEGLSRVWGNRQYIRQPQYLSTIKMQGTCYNSICITLNG